MALTNLRRPVNLTGAKGRPMSQIPPPPPPHDYQRPDEPHYYMPQPRRTNVAAVVSLVSGLALCIPYATGIVAVVLGIAGLRKAKNPGVGGRGMALAGLILGAVSLLGWIVISIAVYRGYQQVRPGLTVTDTYLRNLAAGNTADAQANSTGAMSNEEIARLSQQVQRLGAYRGFTPTNVSMDYANGAARWDLGGRARFGETDTSVSITLQRHGPAWKVSRLVVTDRAVEAVE